MSDLNWWRGAVIYQIYPRSLMDSNGDGIGDLPGIIEKLDYIKSLGVDAIWVSPFFKSPMKDFGYDISDYRAVDPIFGSLNDFDHLITRAHELGLKVMIDQVLSHTSDQHDWFQESCQDKENDKADWYIWADGKKDAQGNIVPPNNWLSIFGGSAWQWHEARQQYYMHNFLTSQPDLNYHNPIVRKQMLAETEFWLKRGVDGFRFDAINFCYHDELLRDNPIKPEDKRRGRGFSADNPYAAQYHIYDNTRPESLSFLEDLRALLDRYDAAISLGEINSEDSLATIAEYTADNKHLHMGYSFELLVDEFSADHIRVTVEKLEERLRDSWPCWAISNHDVVRVLSRWGGDNPPEQMAKMLSALLFSLRGTLCSYQGEELGLPQADIPSDQLQDPFGIKFWPTFKGRDGCRTPMPWTDKGKAAGFSQAKPWLPVPDEHRARAVEIQDAQPHSILNSYRAFLKWRARHPALRVGDIDFIDSAEDSLTFLRSHENEKIVACFNLSDQGKYITLPPEWDIHTCQDHGLDEVILQDNQVTLPPYGVFFGKIICETA